MSQSAPRPSRYYARHPEHSDIVIGKNGAGCWSRDTGTVGGNCKPCMLVTRSVETIAIGS